MPDKQSIVQKDIILDLLYHDEDYLDEFILASIESFKEFQRNYTIAIQNKDLESLRNAGHKIKPAAIMLEFHDLLEMYELSKKYLISNQADQISSISNKMNTYCEQILSEMKNLLNQRN